jgi:hypothetical protein
MDLREIGLGVMDWIHLTPAKGLVEGSCEHDNEIFGSIKF